MIRRPRIAEVVESDLCIACGACVQACPADAVRPAYDAYRGAHEVRVANPQACMTCDAMPCDSVCPSLQVDFPRLARQTGLSTDEKMTRLGSVEAVYLGYCQPHRDNGVSSSGGIVRLLIERALAAGTPVLCLVKKEQGYGPEVLHRPEDMSRVPGSIYHGVSFNEAIPLLRALEQPCYLVSTPCQLEGILKFAAAYEPALLGKIALKIGLICGWMYTDHALHAFMRFKGVTGPLIDAGYRGEDKVGLLKIRAADGEHRFHRRVFASRSEKLDYQASFSSAANRLRCRLCQDHLNVLCDVAVGDAWLARRTAEKLSIIVARSGRGLDVLESLRVSGALHLEDSGAADILESQSDDLVEGITARSFGQYLKQRGITAPRFDYIGVDSVTLPLSARARFGFGMELLLRRLLRSGSYRVFRGMYLLRHFERFFPRLFRWFGAPLRWVRKWSAAGLILKKS